MAVETGDDSDQQLVAVGAVGNSDPAETTDGNTGTLSVSITGTNDPVDAGEYLEVTVQVENAGDADATQPVRLIAGDDQAASRSVTVSPGGTQTITLGYETYPVQQDVEFAVTVQSDDDSASRSVTVFGQ